MSRVKGGVRRHARHRKLTSLTKGYRGKGKNCYKIARNKYEKGLQYADAHRHIKKREYRAIWIQRINAAVRQYGLKYSVFMSALAKAGLNLDRKVLAQMCCEHEAAFKAIVEKVGLKVKQ